MGQASSDHFKSETIDSCITTCEKFKFTYKWTIKDFLELPQAKGENLTSEEFPSAKDQPAYWKLVLYPRGENEDEEEQLSVYLVLQSSRNVSCKFTLEIKDGNERSITQLNPSDVWQFTNDNSNWGFPNFMKRETLKELLLRRKANTLVLNCTIVVFIDVVNVRGSWSRFSPTAFHDKELSKDLDRLRASEICTDLTIRRKATERWKSLLLGDRIFHVHKGILIVRSEVFAAMFQPNMEESWSNEVTIDDVDLAVLEKLLKFMYSGKLETTVSDALLILPVAAKYKIEGLKDQCAVSLSSHMCPDIAVNSYILGVELKLDGLKRAAKDFIAKNTEAVLKTDEWPFLLSKYPLLTTELLLAANAARKSDGK